MFLREVPTALRMTAERGTTDVLEVKFRLEFGDRAIKITACKNHSPRAIDSEAMPNRILRLARELIHPTPVTPQEVISGRIEIERDGKVAYLEYSLGGNVLELIHTDVPKELRGMGLASALAERALKWAREKGYKVDVICPFVHEYIDKHPEYADLVIK